MLYRSKVHNLKELLSLQVEILKRLIGQQVQNLKRWVSQQIQNLKRWVSPTNPEPEKEDRPTNPEPEAVARHASPEPEAVARHTSPESEKVTRTSSPQPKNAIPSLTHPKISPSVSPQQVIISAAIPAPMIEVLSLFRRHNLDIHSYGGGVYDIIVGRAPHDMDFVIFTD